MCYFGEDHQDLTGRHSKGAILMVFPGVVRMLPGSGALQLQRVIFHAKISRFHQGVVAKWLMRLTRNQFPSGA